MSPLTEEQIVLYRYAAALNNIAVGVMERHSFEEASCILEDAAFVARLLQLPATEGSKVRKGFLKDLPLCLNQAAQRLAVISSRKNTCSPSRLPIAVVSTSLDDWSPRALLQHIGKCSSKDTLIAIRVESTDTMCLQSATPAQMNLDLAVIFQNWAVATCAWAQLLESTKDSRSLMAYSADLFRNAIATLRCNGPLAELNQHCLRLLTGWVIALQNYGSALEIVAGPCQQPSQRLVIQQELYELVHRLVQLDNIVCVFANDRAPARAA